MAWALATQSICFLGIIENLKNQWRHNYQGILVLGEHVPYLYLSTIFQIVFVILRSRSTSREEHCISLKCECLAEI